MAQAAPPRRLPRGSLVLVSVVHAAVLGWAAAVLSWDALSSFARSPRLAVLHLAVALAASVRHRRLGWGLLSSAWFLSVTYAGLGAAADRKRAGAAAARRPPSPNR